MSNPSLQSNAAGAADQAARPSRPKLSLGARAFGSFAVVTLVFIAVLFLPAGTFRFWQGWAYLAVLCGPVFCAYVYLWKHDPETLERRLKSEERVSEQKRLMRWARLLSVGIFLLPGFDYRFGWSRGLLGEQPLWLTWLSLALALAGILSALWVLKVNRFAGSTIGVEASQTVISTGPYRIVRHPMYAAGTILWLFTPLALSSWVSLPAFALVIRFCVLRILSEEKVLGEQLTGYTEYCLRTRYRLIPFVW
ncbi:MAG: isoprenylcysteine carboxylmethyltransferase family protein [Terracidiphilus sp.]|jgi:protein-S-isoprenylcysteine O-methyltransferase Ste14